MKHEKPSELEMQVLSVLWQLGGATVGEVRDALPDGRERAYTTVLSVLQGMERKHLVEHRADGRKHVYRSAVEREDVLGPMMNDLVQNVFGGRPSEVLQTLLSAETIDDDELKTIRKLVDKARKNRTREDR